MEARAKTIKNAVDKKLKPVSKKPAKKRAAKKKSVKKSATAEGVGSLDADKD